MGLLGQLSVKILVTYAQNSMIYISLPNVDVLCNVQPYITHVHSTSFVSSSARKLRHDYSVLYCLFTLTNTYHRIYLGQL